MIARIWRGWTRGEDEAAYVDYLEATGAPAARETPGQEVIRPLSNPLKPTGGMVILRGNLAPEGCVLKVVGEDRVAHRGPARVFVSERDAIAVIKSKGPPAIPSSPMTWWC